MKIILFLTDFRSFVKNKKFSPEGNEHPAFYYEDANTIHFYKPIGNVLYHTEVIKQGLPENITFKSLKQEFGAIEIPQQLDLPKKITGTII